MSVGYNRASFGRNRTQRNSRLLFHWRSADVGLDNPRNRTTGALTPLTPLSRQAYTFTRASTATALDSAGNSYNVGHSFPAWSWYGGEPALLVRPASGGRAVDSFQVTFNYATLKNHSGYIKFRAPSGLDVPAELLQWGSAATTGSEYALLALDSDDDADLLELRWSVDANGAITIGGAVNGGDEVAGTSAGNNSGANTAPATQLWIGSRGTAATSNCALYSVKIAAGALTLQQMREAF